jgi:kynureninase
MQASDPLRAGRRVIVTERSNFPTDIYMAQGLAAWLDRGYSIRLVDSVDELAAAVDADTAVVMLTHVNYRTGYQHDMRATSALAHAAGALIVWDLAHSAGAVPVDLEADGADLAVGCTYKYLNGGPGAPAFIWVPASTRPRFQQPLSGWWGHAAPFAMAPDFAPTDGIGRACAAPSPSSRWRWSSAAWMCSANLDGGHPRQVAGVDRPVHRTGRTALRRHPLGLVTPREHARRGSQVSFTHPHGYAVMSALIARGVIGDYREPAIMRFGFTPLYTSFADVWDAVEILRDILDRKDYDVDAKRDAVT